MADILVMERQPGSVVDVPERITAEAGGLAALSGSYRLNQVSQLDKRLLLGGAVVEVKRAT